MRVFHFLSNQNNTRIDEQVDHEVHVNDRSSTDRYHRQSVQQRLISSDRYSLSRLLDKRMHDAEIEGLTRRCP